MRLASVRQQALTYTLSFLSTRFASPRVSSERVKNNAELVPFFLAGLCHPTAGVKKLTATALVTLGLGSGGGGGGGRGQPEEDGERANRCRELLQPALLPALVAALGDADTGAAQARETLRTKAHYTASRRNPKLSSIF